MHKILVPTDFSKNSLKATTYAAEVAQKTGAAIFLLHVMEPGVNVLMDSVTQSNIFAAEIVNSKLEQLDLAKKTVKEIYPDIKVETELSKGSVINSILDFAESQRIDLIIMGTTGASGLKEFFMGSVAAATINRSKIPVLTVPASYEMEKPDAILLATHQFEKNMGLLKKVTGISQLFSAKIYVAVFVDTDVEGITEYKNYTAQLNEYIQFLKGTFPEIIFEGEVLEGKDFEITIDRYSNKKEVDIIAMITYPKSFIDTVLRRSMTKKMAFHSTIPLLAIPANS